MEYNFRREALPEQRTVNELQELPIECPYCGEIVSLLVDASVPAQSYIEDCPVCCQPMAVRAVVGEDGRCRAEARREDDG
jgi:hypothetical protein